jgi:hypothetical protein
MPCRDGTGPRGRGPLTGHGGGECVLRELKASPGYFQALLGAKGRHTTLKIESRFLTGIDTILPKRQKP